MLTIRPKRRSTIPSTTDWIRAIGAIMLASSPAISANAALWAEPWTLKNAAGTPYRVFTPFWRALSPGLPDGRIDPAPDRLPGLPSPPLTQTVDSLGLQPALHWDQDFWHHWMPGEAGALYRLRSFIGKGLPGYRQRREDTRRGTGNHRPHRPGPA